MSLDVVAGRRAAAGIRRHPGVTPNAARPTSWRAQAARSYTSAQGLAGSTVFRSPVFGVVVYTAVSDVNENEGSPVSVILNDTVYFEVPTHAPTTGMVTDADELPTFDVYEEADVDGLFGSTNMIQRGGKTGEYYGSVQVLATNGFEIGKWYSIVVTATVGGVTGKLVVKSFRVDQPSTASDGLTTSTVILTIANPSERLVDTEGTQLSELTLTQTLAILLMATIGDRTGVGTKTITTNIPGTEDTGVTVRRATRSDIETTIVVPPAE